jgi:hypothetical protein
VAKSRRAPEDDEVRRRPDDDDDDDTPRRKSRSEDDDDDDDDAGESEMPRRKRKSAAGPVKLILRICACVAGAIGLLILLYWVYSPVGTDYALLCYFPPETTQLQGYDVDDVVRNGKLKPVHDIVFGNYKTTFMDARINGECGITINDVDKYLSGVASGNPDEEKDLDPQDRRGSLTVIRCKGSIDQGKFVQSFGTRAEERKSKDGKSYYQVRREVRKVDHFELEDDFCFFFPNSRTLVYATTRRELLEAMTRSPGRVVVTGPMRELADKVDGHYFQASTGWLEFNGRSNAEAFGLSFINEDVRDPKRVGGVIGSASWFASNGNWFLYASAVLYADQASANDAKRKLQESFTKAQVESYGSETRKINVEDPFNPKQKAQPGAFAGGGGDNEQLKAIIEGISEYVREARVYNRGRLVIVEGKMSHGMPETGTFEKFWSAVGSKYRIQSGGIPGGGFPGGGPGMPIMPGGAGVPGGPPPGPGR